MGLTWFGWVLVLHFGVITLLNVAFVGRHRDPLTPGNAAFIVAINSLLIWGAVTVGTLR